MVELLAEQQENILARLGVLRNSREGLLEMTKDQPRSVDYRRDGSADMIPSDEIYNLIANKDEIDTLEKYLGKSKVLNDVYSDTITIGSHFVVSVNYSGEIETSEIILAEERTSFDDSKIVSIKSPLGSAVLGKKEEELFSYSVRDNTFNGVITKIYNKVIDKSEVEPFQKTIVK